MELRPQFPGFDGGQAWPIEGQPPEDSARPVRGTPDLQEAGVLDLD